MPDPIETACERAARLRIVRERIILGGQEIEVEHEGGNGTRSRAKFQSADMARLEGLIAEADMLCAVELGIPVVQARRPIIGVRTGARGPALNPYRRSI